jgi:DNA-binding winged helix-turn-helix (wHTH) protein/TolB-like protein/Tfp pilus assembly protein PilF
MLPARKRIYRFGEFTLDSSEHRLLRASNEIYLQPKTFETLLYLVDRHGHLVKKDELLGRLWADAFVTENALTRCIKEAREVLEDDAHQPRFIKTIHRVGYKFIADVEEVPQPSAVALEDPVVPEALAAEPSRQSHVAEGVLSQSVLLQNPSREQINRSAAPSVLLVSIAALVIAATVLLMYYSWPKTPKRGARIRSIAVLPFKPLAVQGGDESLQLGMADTLITTLSNLSQITVRPISAVRKYGGLEQDALVAGGEQRVDAVLDGSIQTLGDRIRVTVRLLRVEDGSQLWSGKFDQKSADIFLVQDSISKQVAEALAIKLTGEERELLTKHYTASTGAYQLYLKGRYFLNKSTEQDFKKSVDYFQQAIETDPNYALAHAGLADAYAQLGSYGLIQMKDSYPRARAELTRALEIDEKLGEAHASLGFILMNYYWDWPEAEKRFRRAVALTPNYAMAHNWYSQHLAFLGRSDEAIYEAGRAQEIDPLSLWTNSNIGFVSYLARHYDDAILASRKTLELDPDFAVGHMVMGLSYVQKTMYPESISELQRASANPDSRALLAYAYARAGKRSEALKIISELNQLSKQKYISPFPVAVAFTGLGENDRAFEALERAYSERAWGMGMLEANPVFDPIRSDPRFSALLRRVNLKQ